jgi:hypothetical protein
MGVSEVLAQAGARVVDGIRHAYGESGPFTTVSLDVGRARETAAHEVELRWRAAGEQLRDRGAPQEHLRALEELASDVTSLAGEVRRTVVLGASGVLVDVEHQTDQERAALVETGPLPRVVPLLRDAALWVPYVLVEVGRTGASVHLRVSGAQSEWSREVKGESNDARKVPSGGWSHRRWQLHVEEVWRGNAEQAAHEAAHVARAARTDLVLVSGDLRVRPDVVAGVRERLDAEVVEVDLHTLPPGSSHETLDEDLAQALRERQRARLDDALTRVREGQGLGGALGLDAVLPCLSEGQVATLLLRPEALGDTQLVALPEAPYLGPPSGPPAASSALGTAPAAEVLARAALLTEADVLVVDEPVPELGQGVAAALRWDRVRGRG